MDSQDSAMVDNIPSGLPLRTTDVVLNGGKLNKKWSPSLSPIALQGLPLFSELWLAKIETEVTPELLAAVPTLERLGLSDVNLFKLV